MQMMYSILANREPKRTARVLFRALRSVGMSRRLLTVSRAVESSPGASPAMKTSNENSRA